MTTRMNHLLGLEGDPREQIQTILDLGREFKAVGQRRIKKVPTLRGVTVVLMFIEPSTRTRMSFEVAAKRLSADTLSFTASSSSLTKGGDPPGHREEHPGDAAGRPRAASSPQRRSPLPGQGDPRRRGQRGRWAP